MAAAASTKSSPELHILITSEYHMQKKENRPANGRLARKENEKGFMVMSPVAQALVVGLLPGGTVFRPLRRTVMQCFVSLILLYPADVYRVLQFS
ncbi:MAG: hypothetical protein E7512_02310 [[Clostridium] sporosphaeroides]|uniref:Uncharacterized protein n=1 Tax=Faecalispora sporosphaeroides TaxID=1549 RepID=A0A928Q454_9FIRM|nr:hypothetical protein [Faecalispora sporosphaeroides]